ncbi:uncharacterized protein [Dermacentor albipictus]|uniref:uncharacterized protein n=1 Tax=Dermacentor albipictus TaxID=60249 RepID=UPI0038FC04B3
MAARDPLPAAALDETTPAAPMDQEPTPDNEDGTWFLVARKRKKQVQATSSLSPNTEPAQQDHPHLRLRNKSSQLPPLPIDDLKVVFRPRDGLNLGEWPQHSIARAIGTAAQLNESTLHQLTIRIRREQNVAVVSTPDEELAYEVQAYVAAPDASCKGVISGIEKNTTPTTLMTNIRSPMAQVLHARMMGNSATAIITFSGIRVPRYIYYYGAEYRCYIHKPRQQLCSVCLSTGHRADACPTPDKPRCAACGTSNPSEGHDCTLKCFHCGGEHPATDSRCPVRQRKPFNKRHVFREQQKTVEQPLQHDKQSRKVTTFNGAAPATTDATRGRRRYRSRGHSQSQSRSRSRVRRPSKDQKHPRGRSRSGSRSLTQQTQPPKEPQAAWTKTPDHHTRKATADEERSARAREQRQQGSSGDNQRRLTVAAGLEKSNVWARVDVASHLAPSRYL